MCKVSLIVTVYNLENYIEKCINSIMIQTFSEFEVLLVDDGSTDNSREIIESLIKSDSRFNYIYKENGGVASARNLGLEKAKGEYLCFIDGDDYLENNYLQELFDAVSDKNASFSICGIKRKYATYDTYNEITDSIVKQCRYPALWNKMIKKELFDKFGLKFIENIQYEDLLLGTEIYLASESFVVVDKPLYNYVQHENSRIRENTNSIFDIYSVCEKIEEFAKENRFLEKHSTVEFVNIYHVLIGTCYRASFHKSFSRKMVKEIFMYVNNKYPNWNNNEFMKELPFSFKFFLKLLKLRMFGCVWLGLTLFKNKLSI